MTGHGQRTEQPTPQRLRKARQEGRFPASREFVAAAQFAVFAALAAGLASSWWPYALKLFRNALAACVESEVSYARVTEAALNTAVATGGPLLLAGAALFGAGLLAQFAVTGFGFAPSRLTLDFSRLNPAPRLKELPGQNLRALREAALLLPIMLFALWTLMGSTWEQFRALPLEPISSGVPRVGAAIAGLLLRSAGFLLVWGAIDLFRQRRKYIRDLRMTKQEVREEWKQNEGSPEMKMRIRRMRRELLRRRMMAEVPNATAVIVNPTHYAVAVKYEMHVMSAPRVVAKGKNYLAQRIREKAAEHQVPIVENPPLARALYQGAEVGQEIPAEFYRAVAEILAYLYRLMNRRPPGGF
jgi:flagellar biosynthetic protein FlhB